MKGDKSFLIFLIFLAVVYGRRVHNPCTVGNIPCDNGQCIDRWDWCSTTVECTDESDEKYCDRKGWFKKEVKHICTEKHFTCEDVMCIPASLRCDVENDCYDGSDEQNCETFDQVESSEKELEYFSTTSTSAEKRETRTTLIPTSTTSTPAQRREISTTAIPRFTDFFNNWRTANTPARRKESSSTALPTTTDFYNSWRTTSTPAQRKEILTTVLPKSTGSYDNWRTTSTPAQRREISTTAHSTSTSPYDNWRTEETHNNIMRYYYLPPLSNTYDMYSPPSINNPIYNRFDSRYPEQDKNRRYYDTSPGENFPNNWQPHVPETTTHGRTYIPLPTTTCRQNPLRSDYPYVGRGRPEVFPLRSLLYPPGTALTISLRHNLRRPEYYPFYFTNSYTPDFERKYRTDIRNAKDWLLNQRDASYGWGRDTPRGLNALSPFSNSFQSSVENDELMRKSLRAHFGVQIAGGRISSCPEDYFTCDDDGRCIPSDRVCDGRPDCVDKTDEVECESLDINDPQAVERAANYLLSKRDASSNWGDFTPRALVALSFTRKFARIPPNEKLSILSTQKIQLLLLLQEGIESIPLHTLALHINALYAMCLDPRDFEGINLIDLLRFRTDKAIGSTKFNKPSVILTLCLAQSSRLEDFELLLKMFDQKFQTTATKALILVAMAVCNRQVETYEYKVRTEEFINRLKMNTGKIGTYTLGLIIQFQVFEMGMIELQPQMRFACRDNCNYKCIEATFEAFNAWGYTSELRNELLIQQSSSGAFQDLLGTYAAIPALLNMSLANLKCSSRTYQEKPGQSTSLQVFSPDRNIDYSLSIPSGDNIGRHTLRVTFSGRKSLFELMEIAASQNTMFRFTYELDGYEKKVTSLAGISNDAESGLSWILYRTAAGHKPAEERVESGDIERIFPDDGDHFVFQLE